MSLIELVLTRINMYQMRTSNIIHGKCVHKFYFIQFSDIACIV